MILFVAYKLFFERDRNFQIRRIYLLGVVLLPILLPLLPEGIQTPVGNIAPLSIQLEGVTITGEAAAGESSTSFLVGRVATIIYLLVLGLGILKLLHQVARITMAAVTSHRIEVMGTHCWRTVSSMQVPSSVTFSSTRIH